MIPAVLPPCQAACPVHTEAGRYARLVAEGRYKEACRVITEVNPFPSVCAHICQRPCEAACRRADVDAPVAIRALKRFVMGKADAPAPARVGDEPLEARVAVIGSGPAGLAAAFDLRRAGCAVTVFERLAVPGGMLNVIPRYRLPREAVESDVERILSTGVEVTCDSEVGRDITVSELLGRGFDAVVAATGLSRSRGIAVPGFGAQRFTAAIPWMTDVWLGNKVDLGKRVAVIGGGNVAVDVARTARRLGAVKAWMICVESREEMPAETHELELAEAEGIEILARSALKRVLNRDGRIAMVELMSVVSVFDREGRFSPIYDPSRIRTLSSDMVILSIGQAPGRSWARGAPVRTDERGRVVVNKETHLTSHPRLFLAGEALRGPGSAIEAVADGQRTARAVLHLLRTGQASVPNQDAARPLDPYPQDVLDRLRRAGTMAVPPEPFSDSEPQLTEREARREGDRCLGCMAGAVIDEADCAWCLTCLRVCPLDAVEISERMYADPVRCQSCGLCAAVCPASAINLSAWEVTLPPVEKGHTETRNVALVCRYGDVDPPAGHDVLEVPCLGRLRPVELLRLFARGYSRMALCPCVAEDCKYARAWKNVEPLAGCVRAILGKVRPEARIEVLVPQPTRMRNADSDREKT